ncbi:pentapeptide repeat-containing protein [Desulfococcaceae bacterium HSG7]|nr:pentapeptide repeat-containing protein [Desulfococcaceae bacterium HSG7]
MTTKDEQLATFRDLYEKGLLDEASYRIALKGLGVDIKDSRVGIVGNAASVKGGINFDNRKETTFKIQAENIKSVIQTEKIDNLELSYGEKSAWINNLWDILLKKTATHKTELEEINTITLGDPLEIARYYVEPDCQDVNPSNYAQIESITSKDPMMEKINGFFQMSSFRRGANQMFVLSDAGMGKTALLTMLKLMELTSLWPKQKRCILKKLGKGTLGEIAGIKKRADAILLLDSLDEDPAAYGRVRERLIDILRATKDFFKVIITCRTQFFPKTEDDPLKRPGFFKIDEFTCNAKYLSFFSDEKVEQYLSKRFPNKFFFWKDKKKMIEAQAVISKMGSLRCRPMLLSYIEDLMASSVISQESSEYHIYDALVQSWLLREKDKTPALSEKALLKACIILATVMQIRQKRSISENDLDKLAKRIGEVMPIKEVDIKGRSLINRNSEEHYRFSHYSIQEFCVAKLLLEKSFIKPKGRIPITDFIFRLIALSGKTPNMIEKLNFKALNFKTPGLKLKGLKLPGADLQGADFSHADLSGADFSHADLSGANFNHADLSGADFSHTDLSEADFSTTILKRVNFKNVNLTNVNFKDADCSSANFVGTQFGVQLRSRPMTLSNDKQKQESEEISSSLNATRTIIRNYFDDQGEVVLDGRTGLMWQKSGSNERLTHQKAQVYVVKMNRKRLADFGDWRLPTLPELKSLLKSKKQSDGLCINPIFDNRQEWCWSSDKLSGGGAWSVSFNDGNVYWRRTGEYYVRVCRSWRYG